MNLSDDDENVLNLDLPEDYTPPAKPFPWSAIILGVVAFTAVLLTVVILWVVNRNRSGRVNTVVPQAAETQIVSKGLEATATQIVGMSPERVVEEFYLAVSQGNNTQAAQYMDPRKPGLDPRVTLLDTTQKLVGSILPADVKLIYQNPTFKIVSQQGDQAQVRMVADLVLVAPNSAFDQMKIRWAYTHEMILIEGNWYIIF